MERVVLACAGVMKDDGLAMRARWFGVKAFSGNARVEGVLLMGGLAELVILPS